ncbi:hypothetical protein [Nibrella viscosa]
MKKYYVCALVLLFILPVFAQRTYKTKEYHLSFKENGSLEGNQKMPTVLKKLDKLIINLPNQTPLNPSDKINKFKDDLLSFYFDRKSPFYWYITYSDFRSSSDIGEQMIQKYNVINNIDAEFNGISYPLNEFWLPPATTDVKISLIKRFEQNKVLLEHIKNTSNLYDSSWEIYIPFLDTLREKVLPSALRIHDLLQREKLVSSTPQFNQEILQELIRVDPYREHIHSLFKRVALPNMKWMNQWYWYTKAVPKINPFFRDPQKLLLKTEELLVLAKERLKLFDSYLTNSLSSGIPNGFKSFNEVKKEHTALMNGVAELENLKKNLQLEKSLYDKWLATLKFTSQPLNESTLYISDKETIRWMHHYDGGQKYKSLNIDNTLPSQIADRDQIIALVYNVPDSVVLDLNAKDSTIIPRTKLAEALDPFEKALLQSLNGVDAMTTLFGKWFPVLNPGSITFPSGGIHSLAGSIGVSADNLTELVTLDQIAYNNLIKEFEDTYSELKWLMDQTPIPAQIFQLKGEENKKMPLHTEVHNVEETLHKEGNRSVTYKLAVKGKTGAPVITQTYTKYARTYFWPALGAVYIPNSRDASVFDEKTGQFSTSAKVDNFEVIAGVKIYPWGTNISRDMKTFKNTYWNNLRGNQFVTSRLFGFLGLGMRHKFLKNYVGGLGFDIVPGFSVQTGANLLFQKRYELENGKVKNEYERPVYNWYIGLSLDPTIVPQIVNIFR